MSMTIEHCRRFKNVYTPLYEFVARHTWYVTTNVSEANAFKFKFEYDCHDDTRWSASRKGWLIYKDDIENVRNFNKLS